MFTGLLVVPNVYMYVQDVSYESYMYLRERNKELNFLLLFMYQIACVLCHDRCSSIMKHQLSFSSEKIMCILENSGLGSESDVSDSDSVFLPETSKNNL